MMWILLGVVLELLGALVFILLGTGWLLVGKARLQELQRRLAQDSKPSLGFADQKAWPAVSVVLPLRGCREHSISNWRTQLQQDYGGSLEFLLAVDSKADEAYREAEALIGQVASGVKAQILVSGPCMNQSQKLCNIQAGIKAASENSKYVICVDDDVALHPSTVTESVAALERDQSAFMLTGYPFDVTTKDSGLLMYSALTYHLPLLIGFCLPQTQFVWGGFMVFRLGLLREDPHEILQAWSDGGYSDDLIVAAKCAEHDLKILSPPFAVFPQWMDGRFTWRQYWNYLRRQLYVMDTYCNAANRKLNHTMMVVHPLLSLAFVLPSTTVSIRIIGLSMLWVYRAIFSNIAQTMPQIGEGQAKSPAALHQASTLIFMVTFLYAASALRWMSDVMLRLFMELSPTSFDHKLCHYNWAKIWLGFYINNAILPVCMLYTKLKSSVRWSGIEYVKYQGKVKRAE